MIVIKDFRFKSLLPCYLRQRKNISYKSSDMGNVCLDNNSFYNIEGVGDVLIKTKYGCSLLLKQVMHVREMRMNLVSTGKRDDKGFHIVLGKRG